MRESQYRHRWSGSGTVTVVDMAGGRAAGRKKISSPVTPRSPFDGKRLDAVVVWAGRLPRQRVEIPPVPGTPEQADLDRPLTEWATLVWTAVVERGVLALVVSQRDGRPATAHRLDSTLG
jgi:hypothetical protein